MQLMSLPSELLAAILVDLDFRDVLHCREVCTRLKTLIDGDVRAQYKIELAISGMEDGPPSTRTTAERVSILRRRQSAWNGFSYTTLEDARHTAGQVWELSGNILARSQGKRTLYLHQIPSTIRGIEGTDWAIPDVGFDITEICMDPAQDLLVLMEHFEDDSQLTCRVHLHLRSLSTGAPHPAGPTPALLTHEPQPGNYFYAIKTSDGYLGILMTNHEYGSPSELLVWDWKTGKLRLHVVNPELNSWAFLTPHSLLTAQDHHVFSMPHLLVIDLESPRPSKPKSMSELATCIFHYPPLEDNVRVIDMLIRSDPAANRHPSPALDVPFSISREDRLFVITLWLAKDDDETAVLSLVPASTFLRMLATIAPGETRREFEWEEWGPWGSRLTEAPTTHELSEMRYPYGMAFGIVRELKVDGREHPLRVVVVCDFNQLAIRHRAGAAGARDGEEYVRIMAEANIFEPLGIFEGEVRTALPYFQSFTPFLHVLPAVEGEEVDNVILAEDALVLVAGTWESPSRFFMLSH